MDETSQAERDLAIARETAIRNAVGLLTTMAMAAGITYVITHRYLAEQIGNKAVAWYRHKRDPHRAATARELADFRRELSAYEHEQTARPAPPRRPGLYERP
jgi:hypothetical protein